MKTVKVLTLSLLFAGGTMLCADNSSSSSASSSAAAKSVLQKEIDAKAVAAALAQQDQFMLPPSTAFVLDGFPKPDQAAFVQCPVTPKQNKQDTITRSPWRSPDKTPKRGGKRSRQCGRDKKMRVLGTK